MRAIVCTAYGPPDVLKLCEIEKPVPRKNELCIKIIATTVTASDCIVRAFKIPRWHPLGFMMGLAIGFKKPRRPVLGIVFSGEIDSIGNNVKKYKKGDQIFGWTVSASTRIKFGSYAEYNCLSEDGILALKPSNINFEEAAAIPYGGLIALHYLKRGNIQPGNKVLIYGASGAIGTAAIQIAKSFGADVTGVCSEVNMKLVKSLGADTVIDYTKENSIKSIKTYDFILDAVGKWKDSELKQQCKKALNPKGRYISVDDGSPGVTKEDLLFIKELVETDKLKPVIDKYFPLEQMADAHAYVDKGHKKGNVVITCVN